MKTEEIVQVKCYHCDNLCEDELITHDDKAFCCTGCKTVYEILEENGLCTYYDLNEIAGTSLKAKKFDGKYDFLDSPEIITQLLNYSSENIAKVTLFIPSVHCSSCVWLLENYQKIKSGVTSTRLNFIKKELSLSFNPQVVSLKEIVELLATLGYAPSIHLGSTEKIRPQENHSLLLKIGVTGFCFGNIMLLSFPEYFKLDLQNAVDSSYQRFFLYLNFILALPVYFYGASDYLKGAYISLKENLKKTTNVLSVDIPIAMGISALFLRSTYETIVEQSSGYWDSLAGLVLFLLVGKWLQQVTFKYLSFEHDYKSYFPLAVKLKDDNFKNVEDLRTGDCIEIKNQQLIPADAILLSEGTYIDYSFVTGESAPVSLKKGDYIYAGGRLIGTQVDLQVEKPVSKSYLTELWNNEAFKKEKDSRTSHFANLFSRYFTYIALAIAVLTGLYWNFNDPELTWKTVTAVLMVACPCALTLALPFAMNTAMSILGRNKFFVKNQGIIPLLAEIDTIAFDKTGTLTEGKSGQISYHGLAMTSQELRWLKSLSSQSVHPLSKLLSAHLPGETLPVFEYQEIRGRGIEAVVEGHRVRIGQAGFLNHDHGKKVTGQLWIEIDGEIKGHYAIKSQFRAGWKEVLQKLSPQYLLTLISGDNEKDKMTLAPYFSEMRFQMKPQDKLDYIKSLTLRKVLMIGDGLNDAGALRQAQVGVALSEDINAFSPSCDVILDASEFRRIGTFLSFCKSSMTVVRAAFILSILYNIVGLGLATTGHLSPLYAAVFMPLSSMSVVLFSVAATYLFARIKHLI
jgi:Cu+-exporting ATPase